MGFAWGFINKFIVKDDYNEMQNSINEISSADIKSYEKASVPASANKTNALLVLLNINIVKLNYSTAVYSKCLLILTFILTILTIVLLLK